MGWGPGRHLPSRANPTLRVPVLKAHPLCAALTQTLSLSLYPNPIPPYPLALP